MMTTKLLLRTAALTCALLLGMTLQAQFVNQSMVFNPSGIENPHVKFFSSANYQGMDITKMREQSQKNAAKAEGDLCTVTLNMEFDPEVYRRPYIAELIDNNNLHFGLFRAFDNGEGALQGQVVPGTYDIVAMFMKKNPYALCYVIYEQQEVASDLTLTLNPDMCVNRITTKNYGPDGELLKLGLSHFDESGNVVVDQESDIHHICIDDYVYLKGFGLIEANTALFGGSMFNEELQTAPVDIYVTDVSDRYLFIQARICTTIDIGKNKVFYSYFSTDNVKTGVRENSPSDYVLQPYTYKYSPDGVAEIGYGVANGFWMYDGGQPFGLSLNGLFLSSEKPDDTYTCEVWANMPYNDPHAPGLSIGLQANFPEYGELTTITLEDTTFESVDYFTGWTVSPTLRVKDGQKVFTNIGHHRYPEFMQYNDLYGTLDEESGTIGLKLLPSPEALTYPTEQALGIIGDNCPINAVRAQSYEQDGSMNYQIQDNFVGRYGESLCCDKGKKVTLKFNGEEVDMEAFVPENKGTFERTCTYSNVEVDGLPSHNTTTVYFDQNQEDMTPPSIEMLHFKNGEGGVTDRFATAADGTMEFYASDFDYIYYPELWGGVFDCQPVEVLVEYAPYGTEDWNELAVEEIPEYYQEPGWGYFYRGSLAGVTGQAYQGWFDLKFRLEDAAGNWQEQVVSPAFRIDNLAYSSVATIGSGDAHEMARYSIDGKRVDASHQGVTIIKMSDGTARKVLVK